MLNQVRGRYSAAWPVMAVVLAACLAGCEAPLVLDGVEKMRASATHRLDRYQAAVRNGSDVVVVGNQGVILTSGDGGVNWTRAELPDWPALIDVTTCPNGAFVALAYDRKVFVSTDGGKSWAGKSLNDTTETPQAITCAPDGRLWVVGSFTYIWSSADLGDTWSETTRDEDAILTNVQFFDPDNGIVTGEFGLVMMTSDGGESWEAMPPLPDEFYPQEAYFRDPMTGWVIGLGGTILHTADGGQSWVTQDSGTPVSLFGIDEVGGTLYVVGGEGTMLAYRGGRWENVDHKLPVRLYLRAIEALDDKRLLIGGVRGALHVFDTSGA